MATENQADVGATLITKIIDASARQCVLVLLIAVAVFIAGVLAIQRTPLDAIPDLSDTQVIIRTDWPGQAPQVIEDQITYRLSTQMLGVAKTKVVRGFSMFGSSFVYIIFDEGVDMYWARNRVLEALSQIQSQLPAGAKTQLGPDATGVGWVLQYALFDRSGKHDLAELRSLQDWFVRYELMTVDGVAEVASVGGFVKEFQVLVNPNKLRAYQLSLNQVLQAVRSANGETGGRTLEMAESEYLIRSFGYVQQVQDLQQAVISHMDGVPVTLADVARVVEGPAMRRGITELNGQGEVVGGFVVMRPGADAVSVIDATKEKIAVIKQGLPEGVELKVVYDRSALIRGSVHYLSQKLIEESVFVALITFLFLLHIRSALVAVVTIPVGIVAAFILMHAQGITVNIMSLGGIAIAIGAMVDASIVMVENAHRKLAALGRDISGAARAQAVLQAAKEVGPGLFFSLLIITVSFLPVFALTGQSQKLFSPLAYTKTYTMAAAALLSITLVPVLMLWLVRGKIRSEATNPINRFFIALYTPCLNLALRWRKTTLGLAAVIFLSTLVPVVQLGSEFMPPLDEGSLLYMPMTLPGVSVTKAREIVQITNRQLMRVPEVKHAFAKAGRAETATDPAPLSMIETWVELHPRDRWRPGMTKEKLMRALDESVGLPGLINSWGYPIKIRLDMLATGMRTPVGIKISGPDLTEINRLAQKIEKRVASLPGTRSAIADRVVGGKYIEIHPDRRAIARYGISIADVQSVIQSALGGMAIDDVIIGRARYAMMLRYDRPHRENVDDIANVLVSTPTGEHIPLADLAEIRVSEGPAMIKSEDARLVGWVLVDVGGRDIGGYVAGLREQLQSVALPPAYTLSVSGQFEQMEAANARLKIVIPATLLLIVLLLYMHFSRWDRTWLVFLSVPFSVTGGLWWLWLAGYNFSVATAVGLIALAGIAVETAIVMLLYIDQQMRNSPPISEAALLENIRHGALQRLRPKLMTVATIVLGLIPIFLTEGPGSDVMRRIALPMVGGMFSTLLLTLIIIPVLYVVMHRRGRT